MVITSENYNIDHFINHRNVIGNNKKRRLIQLEHLTYALDCIKLQQGLVLEFGVYNGRSINTIADVLPYMAVNGFDTFTGLPEEWTRSEDIVFKEGKFKTKNLPNVRDNVTLHKGLFEDTLPKFIKDNNDSVSFCHIDCDLYSSTNTVLNLLNKKIVPGTVIVFDELYPFGDYSSYTNWKHHEYKALQEWIHNYNREFEIVSRSSVQQCAIRIIK